MTNQSDPSMASSPIKHSSAAVVAAKLTYAREGPVTLDIVKGKLSPDGTTLIIHSFKYGRLYQPIFESGC